MTESVNSVIDRADIELHTNTDQLPINIFDYNKNTFGIIRLKMKKTKITNTPLFLLFTIDKTSSIVEPATLYSTKMEVLIQTFKNMIHYLSKQDTPIYIRIHSFSETVDLTIDTVRVTPSNVLEIIQCIENLTADGSTDIGGALKSAEKELQKYSELNPTHQIAHIFMTDGEPTCGQLDHTLLNNLVNDTFANIFVGFGLEHNVGLFRKFSENKNAEYQFVDNMENTALIYGETIHRFLYPAIKDVKIVIENGHIYNWKTNTWGTTIEEPVIVSEIEKIYHVKTTDDGHNLIIGELYGTVCAVPDDSTSCDSTSGEVVDPENKLLDTLISVPDLIDYDGKIVFPTDLTKYIFRQKTQEILFEARSINYSNRHHFKSTVKDLFRKLHKYMRENELLDDPLLKLLCEDISVVYKSLGSRHGAAYINARIFSQGNQQAYNIDSSSIPDTGEDVDYAQPKTPLKRRPNNFPDILTPPPPVLLRRPLSHLKLFDEQDDESQTDLFTDILATLSKNDSNPSLSNELLQSTTDDYEFISDDEIEKYIPDGDTTTCYATPSVLKTMRNINNQK